MISWKDIQNSKLKGFKVSNKGLVKTPTGKVRRPTNRVIEGCTIKVQTFPEIKGFGNININFLK